MTFTLTFQPQIQGLRAPTNLRLCLHTYGVMGSSLLVPKTIFSTHSGRRRRFRNNMGPGDTEARPLFMFEPRLLLPLPNSAWPLRESPKLRSFIGNGHHNACLVRSWEDCWSKLRILVLHARSILSWGAGAVTTSIFSDEFFRGTERLSNLPEVTQ